MRLACFSIYARQRNLGIVMGCMYQVDGWQELMAVRICFN